MDWSYVIFGGLLALAVVIRGFTRRRSRSIEWTFKWKDHHDDDTSGHK